MYSFSTIYTHKTLTGVHARISTVQYHTAGKGKHFARDHTYSSTLARFVLLYNSSIVLYFLLFPSSGNSATEYKLTAIHGSNPFRWHYCVYSFFGMYVIIQ